MEIGREEEREGLRERGCRHISKEREGENLYKKRWREKERERHIYVYTWREREWGREVYKERSMFHAIGDMKAGMPRR